MGQLMNLSPDAYDLGTGRVTEAREKSVKFVRDDGVVVFVPHGHVHEDSDCSRVGDRGRMVTTLWLAERRGWVEKEED